MTLTLSIDTTCTFFELAEGNKLIDMPLFEADMKVGFLVYILFLKQQWLLLIINELSKSHGILTIIQLLLIKRVFRKID
jgi:hypothetical protein